MGFDFTTAEGGFAAQLLLEADQFPGAHPCAARPEVISGFLRVCSVSTFSPYKMPYVGW